MCYVRDVCAIGSGQTVKLDVEGKKSEAIFSELAAVAGVPQ